LLRICPQFETAKTQAKWVFVEALRQKNADKGAVKPGVQTFQWCPKIA